MNHELVVFSTDGMPVVSTWELAEGTDLEHASVIRTTRTYLKDLEEFGGVRFEIVPFKTAGGEPNHGRSRYSMRIRRPY